MGAPAEPDELVLDEPFVVVGVGVAVAFGVAVVVVVVDATGVDVVAPIEPA
jgi:hypothetical protein